MSPVDDVRVQIAQLCSSVVDESATPGESWEAMAELHQRLIEVTALGSPEVDVGAGIETIGAAGKAIAPIEAAHCLFDWVRTRAFAAAVVDAVARRATSSRPVHVVYAGCGPFATLLLPALTMSVPGDLRVTMIDVHRRSIDAVHRVVAALGVEHSIEAIVEADATTWELPAGVRVDVVVAECLQRGLSSEPQVTIARNVVGQAGAGVTLIPECIELSIVRAGERAGHAEPSRDLRRVDAAPVFSLDVDSIARWGPPSPGGDRLPARSVAVDAPIGPGERLAVGTHIVVDAHRRIGDYASGLTHPHSLDVPGALVAGTVVHLAYDTTLPGLVVVDID